MAKIGKPYRYEPTPEGPRAMVAVWVLRDTVLQPLLAGTVCQEAAAPPSEMDAVDADEPSDLVDCQQDRFCFSFGKMQVPTHTLPRGTHETVLS